MEKKKSYGPLILFILVIIGVVAIYYWSTHRWMPIVEKPEKVDTVQLYAIDGALQIDIPKGREQEELLNELSTIKTRRLKRAFGITPPYVLAFYDEQGKVINQINFDKVLIEREGFWQEVHGGELWPVVENYLQK